MEVDEVDDVAVEEAIDEVAQNTAAEETEADLGKAIPEAEGFAPEKNREERAEREDRQHDALAREHAPRGPGVAHMDDVEKSLDDADRAGRLAVSAQRQALCDP